MKLAGTLVLSILLAAVLIAGCVQQPEGPGVDGQLTQAEMENQAYDTIEQEMENAIESMTLEELENELLLQQG